MGRVDLDAVQRIVEPIALVPAFDGTGVRVLMDAHSSAVIIRFRDLQPLLADLAAELRVARELVEDAGLSHLLADAVAQFLDPSTLVAELHLAREVIDRLDPGQLNLAGNRLSADADEFRQLFYAASDALTAYLTAYPRHVQHSDDPGSETQVSHGTPWDKGG